MKKIILSAILIATGFTCSYAGEVEDATKDALLKKTSHILMGTFGEHDFAPLGDNGAFDWAFTTSGGRNYQLQGIEPTPKSAFGWLDAEIPAPTPAWYMFSIDIDGDFTIGPFEWVLLSANSKNKAAYRLKGATPSGNFDYSNPIEIDYKVDGNMIFTGPVGSFSAQDDANSKTVNTPNDIKGYKLTSRINDLGFVKRAISVEFYCDGTFEQKLTITGEGVEPEVTTAIIGDEPNKVSITDDHFPGIKWVGLDEFDQEADGKIYFNADANKLIVNQSSFNGPTNRDYTLESIEKISSCN